MIVSNESTYTQHAKCSFDRFKFILFWGWIKIDFKVIFKILFPHNYILYKVCA